jgi:hypothetical protein
MITDEQAQRIIDAMVNVWGDALPNPDHEPLRFNYYVKLFKYAHPQTVQQALQGDTDERVEKETD